MHTTPGEEINFYRRGTPPEARTERRPVMTKVIAPDVSVGLRDATEALTSSLEAVRSTISIGVAGRAAEVALLRAQLVDIGKLQGLLAKALTRLAQMPGAVQKEA